MRLFWIILIGAWIISLISCTPQQRLNSIVKKHPELAKSKSVSDSGMIMPNLDDHDDLVKKIFLLQIMDSLQTIKNESDKEKVIEKIIEKNIPLYLAAQYKDTAITLKNGSTIELFFDQDGNLHFKEKHPEQIFNVKSETWWENTERRLFKWLLVIVLAIVGIFVFIMLTGSGLRILEHHLIKM